MSKSRVMIRSVANREIQDAVEEAMNLAGWADVVSPGARVVVKPNLCTPSKEIIDVANTSPEVLAALCAVLKTRTQNVVIAESDGVRYSAEEAFEMNGTYELGKRFGFEVMSLTQDELVEVDHPHMKGWPMPKTLFECDAFITAAKIKTHATTAYTGALKNQWGCVPQHDRIVLHKYLHTLIGEVNQMIEPSFALIDGLLGMEGRGPINGRTVRLNVIAAGKDLVAVDAACMRFVGLDPMTAKHIVHAAAIGLGRIAEDEIEVDADCEAVQPFLPAEADWPIRAMNLLTKSEFLTRQLLLKDHFFYPARWLANACRRAKARIMGGKAQDRRIA